MISYEQAVALVLGESKSMPAELVDLPSGCGRFLSEEVFATLHSPAFDNSAVDGFVLGGGEPPYRIVGEIAAGSWPEFRLASGEAARIYTGAPVPDGTASIAMIEDCEVARDVVVPASRGDHVRKRGEDYRAGERIAGRGDLVTPSLVGLLASAGADRIPTVRLPRVGLLTTGDEAVPSGTPLAPGQIFNSNGPALQAALLQLGVQPEVRHVSDDADAVQTVVEEMLQVNDVLITCGGVSAGAHDHLKEVFHRAGVEQVFWKAALKPGKPIWFGRKGEKLVFGLPGNPASSLVTYFLFTRPALIKLMGGSCDEQEIRAELQTPQSKKPGRTEFMRSKLSWEGGKLLVTPLEGQGSHMLLGTGHADCLVIFPAGDVRLDAGTLVQVVPLRWGLL